VRIRAAQAAPLLVALVAGCGASNPTLAVPDHAQARDFLGLKEGAFWRYTFEATISEDENGITRQTKTHGGYIEKVLKVEHKDGFTVVKVVRETLETPDADDGGWNIQRKSGLIYYLIGPEGRVHTGIPPDTDRYDVVHPGRQVFIQRGELDLSAAPETWLAYMLPLRPGTMWHAHPEAREMAATQKTTSGIRTVSQRTKRLETKAGAWEGCSEVVTPASRTRTTVWVCPNVGMVRRVTERRSGNPRFVILETLDEFVVP